MIETSHYLIEREPDGEIYCSRCGLHNPSEEDQSCIVNVHDTAELEKAA